MTPAQFVEARLAMRNKGHTFDLRLCFHQDDGETHTVLVVEYDNQGMLVDNVVELSFDHPQAARSEANIISSALGLDIQTVNGQKE